LHTLILTNPWTGYIAPEILDETATSPQCDIWSAAIVLLRLMMPLIELPSSVAYKLDDQDGLDDRDVHALEEL